MGACLCKDQPQLGYQNVPHDDNFLDADNHLNHSMSDERQVAHKTNDETEEISHELQSVPIVEDQERGIAVNYDKLSWKIGTLVKNSSGRKCKIINMRVENHIYMHIHKPAITDIIRVEFEDGTKKEYRRNQLHSTKNYLQKLRKLCPGCTIAIRMQIQHKSQWIPCYVKEWWYFNASKDRTDKKKFLITFDKNQQIKEQQICRYSHEIRCCKPLLKLSKNSNVFVFDAEINQWCYGKIKSVIKAEDKGTKWLDLDVFFVCYRKNGNIYSKYVNQFSANVAVMDNSVDTEFLITDEDIQNEKISIHRTVTDLKYIHYIIGKFMLKWSDQDIYDHIRFIIVDYIGYAYGIMMYIESQTYHLAIGNRTINLTPKDSTIHDGIYVEKKEHTIENNICCKNCLQKPAITCIKQRQITQSEISNHLPQKHMCRNILKLTVDCNIFVFNKRMWCYGKVMKVIKPHNQTGNNILQIYYRYNATIYVKYMFQSSSSIGLINPLVHKKFISKKEVKRAIYPADVSHYELLIFAYMRQQKINLTDNRCIAYTSNLFAKYIGCCVGLVIYIESKTKVCAVNQKDEQMFPKTNCKIHDDKLIRQRNNNNSYKSNRVKKIEKDIRIGSFTDTVSRCCKENICNLYLYTLNIHCMQFGEEDCKENFKIFNYNIHDKYSNEILYGVATKCKSARFYTWCMMNKLFSAKDILDRWGVQVSSLPPFDNLSCKNTRKMKLILQCIMTETIFKQTINKIKWKKIKVYHGYETKVNRLVWQLTQECFKDMVIGFYDMNNKDINLFPILIMDDTFHIEFLYVMQLPKNNKLVNIGLSFDCDKNNKLIIGGIHLNKNYIANQCKLADTDFDFECLDGDEWSVDDMQIGNPDDALNKIKAKNKRLKQLKAK